MICLSRRKRWIVIYILVPRGQESRPPDRSSEIPILIVFANTKEWDRNQSDLSDITLSMRKVTEVRESTVRKKMATGTFTYNALRTKTLKGRILKKNKENL